MSSQSTRPLLDDLSRRLFEVQERELKRLAEELRESVSQRLALCAVELERVQELLPDSEKPLLDTLREKVSEACGVAQSLSHELHSPVLEYVGLAGAMRGFCREFAERHHRSVEFAESDVLSSVPTEISTCLFRVLQEALNNIVAYRGGMSIEVKLQGRPNEIHLFIWGLGVTAGRISEAGGDGPDLISMRERVRLVEGSLSISSNLQIGMQFSVRVPLPAGASAIRSRSAAR
jgi:signal transduction histidine kinase